MNLTIVDMGADNADFEMTFANRYFDRWNLNVFGPWFPSSFVGISIFNISEVDGMKIGSEVSLATAEIYLDFQDSSRPKLMASVTSFDPSKIGLALNWIVVDTPVKITANGKTNRKMTLLDSILSELKFEIDLNTDRYSNESSVDIVVSDIDQQLQVDFVLLPKFRCPFNAQIAPAFASVWSQVRLLFSFVFLFISILFHFDHSLSCL